MVKLHRSVYWALFLLLFGLEFAVGYYVSHVVGYVHSDAMSRVANAFYVLFSRNPHLGAIGFVWTPLPSLVDLVFLLPYHWFPALASSGLAGVIMSSLFAGMTAAMLARAAVSFGMPGWFAILFSLLFSCNPFMFLFGANGMSDSPFIFFIMYSVVHLSHWIRTRNVRSLIKVSFALALAFWTRYEAVPLGAAMGLAIIIIIFLIPRHDADTEQLPRHTFKYKYFHVEGTWVLMLSPIVFSGLLWIWFNYLIMGNPLFFLNGDYSNVAQAQQLASEEKFAEMIGHPIPASLFVLKKTAYYSIPLLSIILLRIWNQRWILWDFLVLILLFVSIITLQWLMLLKGTSYGWFRYFMYVLPITVAWLPYELASLKKSFLNYTIVISGMAATCVLLTSALMNPQIAPDENKFIQAKHYAVSQTVEKEIAQYLDTDLAGYNILMDSYSAYSVILNSQHPEKYLITSDFKFHESLEDPVGSGVDFILSPKPDKSSADSIDNQKYQLYEKGAPWCELYKEFGGKWRLYKVIRTTDGGSRMNSMEPEISVIIPVFNEEVHIVQSLSRVEKEINRITSSYEIIIIDDGSKDSTWDKLTQFGELSQHFYALRLSRNFGKELAMCAGLEHARGKAVIIMDSDMQHPPELLQQMVHLWREEGKDVVECVKRSRGNETLDKAIGSSMFYTILNKLSGYELRGASDYKLLDQKVVRAWREMPERSTFFRGMVAWLGFDKAQIDFEVPERVDGNSQWSFTNLLKLAVNAVVAFSSIPLRFVSIFGVIFFLGAIILGIQTLFQKFLGNAVTGFTTVILLLLIIGSVIMISLGIIGEYIASIYNEVKGRPRYLVSDKIHSMSSETEQALEVSRM